MNKTLIPWAKNPDGSQGYTLNPITGCKNCTPEGLCLSGMFPCYAYKLANGRLRTRYLANKNIAPVCGEYYQRHYGELSQDVVAKAMADPFYPRFWPEKLKEFSELAYKPKGIFTCDMSDPLGIGVPEEWTRQVLSTIKYQFFHRFYLLTKQPQNLINFSPFPDNCWVGVTLPTKRQHLALFGSSFKNIEAKIKYVSLEPLLENLYIHPEDLKTLGINWVIIGACTGTLNDLKQTAMRYPDLALMPYGKKWTLQPKIEWVEEIVRACDKAGVPVFLKDNLSLNQLGYYALDWAFKNRQLRQEMPE